MFIQKIITLMVGRTLMKIARNCLFVFACVTGALSVLTAAYVAHQPGLDEAAVRSLQSALQMQQFHALALLITLWMSKHNGFGWSQGVAAAGFAAGILCFSFNIELRYLAGVELFRPLTPYGGMAFVLAWLALMLSVFQRQTAMDDSER
jgi:uncharacterized membrane protein YgdD (TMEM256/DUF423 family)